MRIASWLFAILLAVVPLGHLSALCPPDGPAATQLGPGRPGLVHLQPSMPADAENYTEHCDGTFENGYCWRHGGVADPYFGAFAERFSGPAHVVGMRLYISTNFPPPYESTTDIYVWGAGVNGPGAVLAVVSGIEFASIPTWPDVGGFDFPISAETGPIFYVGSQANFGPDASPCWWYNGADCDGTGGSPWTCVAPGQGYPTGWQDPAVIWSETNAMGYGVFTTDVDQGIPDEPADRPPDSGPTWGAVKSLFRW